MTRHSCDFSTTSGWWLISLAIGLTLWMTESISAQVSCAPATCANVCSHCDPFVLETPFATSIDFHRISQLQYQSLTPSTVAPLAIPGLDPLPREFQQASNSLNPETWFSMQEIQQESHPTGCYDTIAAEPDDLTQQLSFRTDLQRATTRLKSDFVAVLQPNNLALLAVAAGGAIAIHQDLDDQVRQNTLEHPQRWGKGSHALNFLGEAPVQMPVLAGIYFWSLKTQNEELHDVIATTMSAYTINGLSTVLLKTAVNTQRPSDHYSGGHYGFPSFHTSSTFTLASVMNEYYGWEVGVPAYVVAGLVGWSRIDSREHDLSDVVFGAALGYVIGTSVARHHLTGDSRVLLFPWNEPTNGAIGLACEWRY